MDGPGRRKATGEETLDHAEKFAIYRDFNEQLIGTHSVDQVIELAIDALARLVEAEGAAAMRAELPGADTSHAADHSLPGSAWAELPEPTRQALLHECRASSSPLMVRDAHAFLSARGLVPTSSIRNFLALPADATPNCRGALFIYNLPPTADWDAACADATSIVRLLCHSIERVEMVASREKQTRVLEAILERTSTHIAYLDPDLKFVMVNSVYEQGCGHSRDELIGRNHFEFFPHTENEAIFKRVRDTGEPVEFRERPFVYRDQPERGVTYWDWTLAPIKDESGRVEGLVLSLSDLTERVRSRQELEKAERERDREARLLRTILDSIDTGVVYLDPDFTIRDVNPSVVRQGGYAEDQVLGLNLFDLWPLEYARPWFETARDTGERIGSTESAFDFPDQAQRGTTYWSWTIAPVRRETGETEGLVLSVNDVTEHVRARQRVEDAERERAREAVLLNTILESAPNLFAFLDRDLKFQRVNSSYARARGLPETEILGRTFGQVFHLEADLEPVLQRCLEKGEALEMREFVPASFRDPESESRYFDITITPVKGAKAPEGLVISMSEVTDNVTQRERLVEVERARAQLAETLTTEVNHRMKNSLAMVAGLLEMEVRDHGLTGEMADHLRTAAARIGSIAAVHEHLHERQSEQVELVDALRRISRSSVQALSRRDVDVSVEGGEAFYPSAVATSLCVIASELVVNGLKHGAPGKSGRLEIRVQVGLEQGRRHISVWNSGSSVPTDFDPTKQRGLGLRLVTELATEHYGGAFSIEAKDGGTLARVHIEEARLREDLPMSPSAPL